MKNMEYGRRIGTVRYGRLELAWEQQQKHLKKKHIRHSIGTKLANYFSFDLIVAFWQFFSSRPGKRSLIYTQNGNSLEKNKMRKEWKTGKYFFFSKEMEDRSSIATLFKTKKSITNKGNVTSSHNSYPKIRRAKLLQPGEAIRDENRQKEEK